MATLTTEHPIFVLFNLVGLKDNEPIKKQNIEIIHARFELADVTEAIKKSNDYSDDIKNAILEDVGDTAEQLKENKHEAYCNPFTDYYTFDLELEVEIEFDGHFEGEYRKATWNDPAEHPELVFQYIEFLGQNVRAEFDHDGTWFMEKMIERIEEETEDAILERHLKNL